MQIEQKNFSGILNRDDEDDVRPLDHHKVAFNVKFRGNGQNKRVENLEGTTLIPNADLPPGTNVTIGCFYDAPKQRLFWFVYNSLGANCIYIIYLTTKSITRLVQCGWNTDGDILEFDIKVPIINVQIIYGDEQQGDVLYWINSQKLPCQININQQLNGEYGTLKKDFLNVIKAIPQIPPQVVYEDDATVTVNNLRRKLYKPKYRFVYNNNDKSCWSSHGQMPIPLYYGTLDGDADPSLNADIAMVLQTGDTNVKKIEIAMCESLGNVYSDFFLVAALDKEDEGIPDNDTTIFRFYNDKAYNYIDLKESIQLFDLVPLEANAMELLNGNVLIYGGIKESYNPVTDFTNGGGSTTNANGTDEVAIQSQQPCILVATQDGQSAYGTGNIHIVVLGKITEGNVFDVTIDSDTVTYTAILNDTTTEVIAGLASSATGFGFTVVSSDDYNLYLSKASSTLLKSRITYADAAFSLTDSSPAFDWKSKQAIALVYCDKDGVSCGAVTNPELSWTTIQYDEDTGEPIVPYVHVTIWHQPPLEAEYFQIVQAKNLSKSNLIQWISDRTYKDVAVELDNYTYAYISIQNLNNFKADNPGTPLGYQWVANDRITFMKLYNDDGTTNQIYTNKDYQIQSSVENPVINGATQTGQFIKIILPDTDSTFDFGLPDFQNYFIELYTPAQSVANGLDVYYERGYRWKIIDAGTANRRHQGQLQNQSIGLGTPATFDIKNGDFYYRRRKINVGNELKYTVDSGDVSELDFIPMTLTQSYTNTAFDAQSQQPGHLSTNVINSTNYIIQINDQQQHVFNITGSFVVRALNNGAQAFKISISLGTTGGTLTYDLTTSQIGVQDNEYVLPVNVQVTAMAYASITKMVVLLTCPDFSFQARMLSGNLIINEEGKIFTQGCIDPNFSDYYPSAVNSNGRAWIVDANAAQVYNGALLRWGLAYQVNTNINQTNRFYDQNFDEIDRSVGDILRLMVDARTLYAYQYRGVGWLGVYTKFIQDSAGNNQLTTTDEIITKNNVQYYAGEYGLGTHPESLFAGKTAHYFFDPIRGYWVRRSNNGLEPFSEIFKGQYYIRSLITPYNKTWDRPDGGYAKMLGCYNYFEEQATAMLQSGTNGEDSISAYTFSFNEKNKGFCSFYDIYAEWITCVEDKMVAWLNGNIYFFDNTAAYNNFFGVQYDSYIEVSFNDARMVKKGWISMSQLANVIWEATSITTQLVMGSNSQQESYLLRNHFATLEGQYHASFRRASNSRGGIINGQFLKGGYMTVRLQPTDSSSFVYLSGLSVKWIDSPLTTH